MIARHDVHTDKADIWSRLAEPLPNGVVYWRQDGKPIQRDGKYFARFVAYIEANTARERLDAVVPGEWDLTLELLPPLPGMDDGADSAACSFKARLQILGVIREDVGTGRDYKSAATDAFKRAAVRFGIAHELYAYEQNWVQIDSDSRYAKPVEDPGVVYARRFGPANGAAIPEDAGNAARSADAPADIPPARSASAKRVRQTAAASATEPAAEVLQDAGTSESTGLPSCPKCGGRVWDNRLSKRNPKAPDYKCRDRSCDGVIWPARGAAPAAASSSTPEQLDASPLGLSVDDIPF
ncbi:MAG TPA: Rad52/Rad22 family DNA repair protein [Gemmatimonadaceae bacterium]|nr:Rad52/Rad22 family DNA repair protein [Gemmatimonadaceae bacterium]